MMIVKRVLRGILTLFITIVVVFALVRAVPGDPAQLLAGSDATEEQIQEMRVSWGLDKPITEQFWIYVKKLATGDMGVSYQFMVGGKATTPVSSLVFSRLPRTLLLAVCTLIFSMLCAIPLGVLCALKPGSLFDNLVTNLNLFITSFPGFYIAMVLILLFALRLNWLPTGGYGTIREMILPTLCLSTRFIASLTRVTRAEVGMILNSDYIRTAKSKGLRRSAVLFKHALRNAAIPIVTLIGMRFSKLVTGSVYIEALFRFNGMGQLLISSVNVRDYSTIQALIPYTALMFIACNIVVDLLYGAIDPRVRNK